MRQFAGVDELDLEVTPGHATVASLCDTLIGRIPQLRSRLSSLLIAVNGEYSTPEARLKDGDEVALLPPFSGG